MRAGDARGWLAQIMDETTYKFLVVAGSWLAGIGSLTAVITSLWLSRRSNVIRLGIRAKHVQLVTPGEKEAPDYVQVNIVNKGLRPAKITGVGWRIGILKKVHFVQLFGDINSDKLPKMLNEGEEANLLVKFHENFDDDDWIVSFPRKALLPNPKWKAKNLKVIVFTSVGQSFKKKIDKNFRKTLIEASKHIQA
ncbi:MAG: hypothetical protein LWX51_12165 [Deltaproteobacteria bacterium]|nr:hypothetical protein [Deltaproteobacteria bacterium]